MCDGEIAAGVQIASSFASDLNIPKVLIFDDGISFFVYILFHYSERLIMIK